MDGNADGWAHAGSDNVCNPTSGACRQGPNFVGRKEREEEKRGKKERKKRGKERERKKKKGKGKKLFALC